MRGGDDRSGSLFSYVELETRVAKGHPLRRIRGVVNEADGFANASYPALSSRSRSLRYGKRAPLADLRR